MNRIGTRDQVLKVTREESPHNMRNGWGPAPSLPFLPVASHVVDPHRGATGAGGKPRRAPVDDHSHKQ